MKPARGFTLIEILVAMTVLAVGLLASVTAVGQLTSNHAYLRDRTLASWVAHNQLLEEQLKGEWPGIGDRTGDTELAGRDWAWRITISQTPEQDMRRLDVQVWPDEREGEPLALLSGFLEKP